MANSKISALTSATTPLAGTETLPVVQSGVTTKVTVANLTAGRAVSLGVSTIIGPDQTTASISTASNIDAEISSTGSSVNSGGSLIFSAASAAWKFAAIKALATNGSNNTQGSISIGTRRVSTDATLTEAIRFHASGGISINSATDPAVGNLSIGTGNIIQGTAAKGFDFSANTPAAGKTSTLLNWYEEGTWTPNQGAGLTLVGAFSSTGKYTRVGRNVTVSGTVTGATSVAVTAAGVITTNLPFTVGTAGHGNATNVAVNASAAVICTSTSVTSAAAIAATATITFSATYFV